ncbi:MAG TPA: IclR family transcriptional regulator [Jiangellaceae bacterium]|nr:IclR family transcriptional regulator [Jiangellaceae bacterium]
MEQNSSAYRVEAVDRALVLLSLLVERESVTVSVAAHELAVAPSTAHRLLATLCYRDYAVQGPDRSYRPGPALQRHTPDEAALTLVGLVRPYLERLYEWVGETVHLVVPVGADTLFVDGVEGTQALRIGLRTGTRIPAYCTSGGKHMLAQLDWESVEQLHSGGLRPWPGAQVTNMSQLRTHLDQVRATGYGLNTEESEPGVIALGAAIVTAGGAPAGAISVSLPAVRFDPTRAADLSRPLLEACTMASHAVR